MKSEQKPREIGLKETMDGCERAAGRVASWPKWKRELSMGKDEKENHSAGDLEEVERTVEQKRNRCEWCKTEEGLAKVGYVTYLCYGCIDADYEAARQVK